MAVKNVQHTWIITIRIWRRVQAKHFIELNDNKMRNSIQNMFRYYHSIKMCMTLLFTVLQNTLTKSKILYSGYSVEAVYSVGLVTIL